MKTSFTTLGCPDWTLEEIAKNAKALGYDGVELRTHPDGNHFSPEASLDEAKRLAGMFREAGAPVMSLMGYTRFAFLDEKAVAWNREIMRKQIGLAGAMGAPFIRSFCGGLPEGVELEAMADKVAETVKPLAEEAAESGIVIGLETHDDWTSGDSMMKVVEKADSKGLGIVFDICNVFEACGGDWETTYNRIKGHVPYCHLKDGYRGPDGKLHSVMLGAGDLPLAEILARFKADGYDGFFSFEWEKKWHPELEDPERAFPQFSHKVRAVWDAL